MDYKSRNQIPLNWTRDLFNAGTYPEPYDVFSPLQLKELDAPDRSTKFLVIFGNMDAAETSAILYAIEAPASCLQRKAFERGDLSWSEFWKHRGWLLQLKVYLNDGPLEVEYIEPSQMSERTIKIINRLGDVNPFEMKRQRLERDWENAPYFGRDTMKAERDYRDYLIRHASRFAEHCGAENLHLEIQKKTA